MSLSMKARLIIIVLAATTASLAGAEDLRGPETFSSLSDPSERARAVRGGGSRPAASALPELPPGRRAADAGRRPSSAFPAGGPRFRRQGGRRHALHDLPPECELRAVGSSRTSAVACRAEVDGMADQVAGSDLRADQGPAAQRRQDAGGDPRAHGARLAGRLGVDTRRKPRARARHAGTAGRVDRRVDSVWCHLPRILTTDAGVRHPLLERGALTWRSR